MDEDDLAVARLLERQILKEKRPLACGCWIEAKYGHPIRRDWVLVNSYISACVAHKKISTHYALEKEQEWSRGSFIPKWRDGNGLWVLREEWQLANFLPSAAQPGTPSWIPGPAVLAYKNAYYLLLAGYLGTPVALGKDRPEKMRGRAICLDLRTGKTIPLPVDEDMLQRFGWKKEE